MLFEVGAKPATRFLCTLQYSPVRFSQQFPLIVSGCVLPNIGEVG